MNTIKRPRKTKLTRLPSTPLSTDPAQLLRAKSIILNHVLPSGLSVQQALRALEGFTALSVDQCESGEDLQEQMLKKLDIEGDLQDVGLFAVCSRSPVSAHLVGPLMSDIKRIAGIEDYLDVLYNGLAIEPSLLRLVK